MTIGILLVGTFPDAVRERHGEYDGFFRAMLQRADPQMQFLTVNVEFGEALPAPDTADGWIITGSRHGVYEAHPWLEPLKDFIRQAVAARVPMAGVCFGHQIMAEALGGRAELSSKGWALGVEHYAPRETPGWLPEGVQRDWTSIAIHRDQVVELPPRATVLAGNDFCPYAALAYGDPEAPEALSVQPHPEYGADLLRHMMAERIGARVAPELAQAALDSLETPLSGDAWAETFVRFFRQGAGL